ncbi:MAG: YbaB/EbfC family nucleoid-associated protein [Oscillospiraceae bacterium]|nr:YbaB/EbfC family nucleoid-associated protein [Oscillospiraceae bacterium]
MKARLPKGYQSPQGGSNNLEQITRKAQELQEKMQKASEELEKKEYSHTAGGGAVEAVVTGKLEVEKIILNDQAIDKDDKEMLTDLIIAAVNGALRLAKEEKEATMDEISGGLEVPGGF